MVTNLAKEVTDLKNDITLLKQEIKALHSLIEASPRPISQHITREQRILPAEKSNSEAARIQRVPSAVLPNLTLPAISAISVPAEMTLSNRDVAATGIPPSGPTALPDPDGFTTVKYRGKIPASTPPDVTSAATKVKPCRQPLIGVRNSASLPVVVKKERMKALFVSRFSPEVAADDGRKSLENNYTLKSWPALG
jgi:hypothetical protein